MSLSIGLVNGPERGRKTVSFNSLLPVIEAYSADPDQTPRCAASDLGLHCLPISEISSPGYTDNPLSTAL